MNQLSKIFREYNRMREGFLIMQTRLIKPQIFFPLLLIISLRIIFIFLMGPMPQDAYYYFYSAHPALSYFDHPCSNRPFIKDIHFSFWQKRYCTKVG